MCLGVEIDSVTFTVAIPAEKLKDTVDLCEKWHHTVAYTKRELQFLLGTLLYASKCVPPSRFFINRMLDTLRKSDKQTKIILGKGF